MIKINLALKKMSAAAAANTNATTGTGATATQGKSLFKFDARLDGMIDLPIRKYSIYIGVAFALSWFSADYKENQIRAMQVDLEQIQAAAGKLKADIDKTRGYEPLKKQLDQDESLIKSKIDTVQKLISDRQTPPKLFAALSTSIPESVWLSEVQIQGEKVQFTGSSEEYTGVTDFFKSIGDSTFFESAQLSDSKSAKDNSGGEIVSFILTAKRRKSN